MRVLVVSPFYPPLNAVASLRVAALARALRDAGHTPLVLTAPVRADQAGSVERPAGVDVREVAYRVPAALEALRRADPARAGAVGGEQGEASGQVAGGWRAVAQRVRARTGVFAAARMPDLTGWWIRPATAAALAAHAAEPFGAVVSSSGPYSAHVVAGRVRAATGLPWLAEWRDLWTANHIYSGLWPFTLRERAMEAAVLRAADAHVTVSQPLAAWLRGRARGGVSVVENGYEPRACARAVPPPAPGEAVRVVHAGSWYAGGQDPRPVLEGLGRAARAGVAVRMVAAGAQAGAWRAAAGALGVGPLVETPGQVPAAEALRLIDTAHALVSLEWLRPEEGALTGKFFEYLPAAGVIVVAGPEGPIGAMAERLGRGVRVGTDAGRVAGVLGEIAQGRPVCARERDEGAIAAMSREARARRVVELVERVAAR